MIEETEEALVVDEFQSVPEQQQEDISQKIAEIANQKVHIVQDVEPRRD